MDNNKTDNNGLIIKDVGCLSAIKIKASMNSRFLNFFKTKKNSQLTLSTINAKCN